MDFLYGSSFLRESPDAYERLLLDAMLGDTTLFIRADEVEQAWAWSDPIEERWAQHPEETLLYPAGSWGPSRTDRSKIEHPMDCCESWIESRLRLPRQREAV